ncbi:hypothetical protein HPB48_001043 [Haemaphysalis longicornis]|uniref:Uncharacterized protein n=1 Tax=Haemaphysalis longicornis TaxID=44386 RepID=A0A9J6G052_HAELO|nr:hypothetical protein HPB48_001043 [Haemaphysalis longicornis]
MTRTTTTRRITTVPSGARPQTAGQDILNSISNPEGTNFNTVCSLRGSLLTTPRTWRRSGLSGAGDAPQFYGNVMWLGAVMDNVVHKLRSELPQPRARNERFVFTELLGWQRRLQQCNSAADFVAAMGL